MSVKADGTLLIETGVDLEGFETDCRKLQQSAKRAAKSILDIEKKSGICNETACFLIF